MSASSEILPPPSTSADFETLCLDLWRELWNDPNAIKNGRDGQAQAGVDIYGTDGKDQWFGVQCKLESGLSHSKLTIKGLRAAVAKAAKFRPRLATFVVATTGPRDARIQQEARELSSVSSFAVAVWAWDDIWIELYQRPRLLERIKPVYWPRLYVLGNQKLATSRISFWGSELFGRAAELERLEAAWRGRTARIVSIVGWGGVGKSSLVVNWVSQLARRNFDGADYLDWSFYSQGTRDQTIASADAFVDAALRFFGDATMADSQHGPWDKGARLAQLVGERKTLLVLDGLEPLQHPPGPMAGELKDPAIKALLRGLALRNAGLCVVTTRATISDLESYRQSGVVHEWKLDRLSEVASVDLLGSLGVQGAKAEIEQLAIDLKGHALTLNLMGRFLRDAHDGDVRKSDLVQLGEASDALKNGHAFHVMAAYEGWFAAEVEKGKRQLALLRLLGLFDRPADLECLAALRREPVIAGLTEALVGQKEATWKLTVKQLVETGLVEEVAGGVDAHPLIREYFASRLRESGDSWQEAHGRLFDFLKDNTPYQPDTLAGLQPLYQAVYHGCQAGRQQEALKVYRDRIHRGTGVDGFYSTRKLGAFGADLGAVACFFESPWGRVSPSLSEVDQAWLLNEAAFSLRALGRLREAVEPMRAGLDTGVRTEDWKEAARRASNLSELELTLGEVQASVVDAEQSMTFADRSGDAFLRMVNRTVLAGARHQAGEEGAALALFREAEVLQAERQPQYPLLYSLQGFQYCDLLLAPAERAAGSWRDALAPSGMEACAEVERRATQTLRESEEYVGTSLLDVALNNLSFSRARLYQAILEGRASEAAAEVQNHIERAVAGLRASGDLTWLPQGLLTRAWLRFAFGDAEGARVDLEEAEEIAERGSMRLQLADVALYRARFFEDRAALAEAQRLVAECGYGRRLAEIVNLESRASSISLPATWKADSGKSPNPDPALSELEKSQFDRAEFTFAMAVARRVPPSVLQNLDLAVIQDALQETSIEDAQKDFGSQQIHPKPNPIWLAWLEQKDRDI